MFGLFAVTVSGPLHQSQNKEQLVSKQEAWRKVFSASFPVREKRGERGVVVGKKVIFNRF